jgi:hypothetical protein
MRIVSIVPIAVLLINPLSLHVVAQQTGQMEVVMSTMINEQSRDAIEFQRVTCRPDLSGVQMTCDFHVAVVSQSDGDTCYVTTTGFRRVLRRRNETTWMSDPGHPDAVCGTSDTITLRSSSVATHWTMTRQRTTSTRAVDELFCKWLPRHERFTPDGQKTLRACRVFRPATQ